MNQASQEMLSVKMIDESGVTVHQQATSRARKFAVLGSVIALHAAIIALLLQQVADVKPPAPATSIAMIALEAEPPAGAKPPPPSLPAKVADTFVPVTELSISEDTQSDAPAGASAVCSTLDKIREGILMDSVAVDAIRNAPPETRSIADAIVVWNVGWAPSALTPPAPLFAVRVAVERSLTGVPDHCLDEAVTGPRLVPIPDESGLRTIFIVFGSDIWTWRALHGPPPTAEPQTKSAAPVPAPPPAQ